jgi:hypothetical protein
LEQLAIPLVLAAWVEVSLSTPLVLAAWAEASLSTSSTVSFLLLLTRGLSLSRSSSSQS